MSTEHAILQLLAQNYDALRDSYRALKCRQALPADALPMLEQCLSEHQALLQVARLDMCRQVELSSRISALQQELGQTQAKVAQAINEYRLLVDYLRQLYPG